jgi:phosphoribosylformimino-5-aminoimidazole carboxamide ribotide isomerase
MRIVPVIDIKNGFVVHAIGGERANYRPVATPLSTTSRPSDVIDGYLRLFPFETFYVADLNAIEGDGGANDDALAELARFTRQHFWIDSGAGTQRSLLANLPAPNFEGVIGSETLSDIAELHATAHNTRLLLSLDFRGGTFLGPQEILTSPELWPRRVIVMTLTSVGRNAGPDFDRVFETVRRAESREVYAAGGVRDANDLEALAERGVVGALVASALHSGALSAADLRRLSRKEKGSR